MKMKLPKISIVICTLNCKDDLKECLESIRNQDYPKDKVEVIIVDSYSDDGTIELAKSFGAKVILTKKRGYMEGKGMPKSMGCKSAKGSIIITIDSDNSFVEKDWLRKIADILTKDKEVSFCISRMLVDKKDALINQYLSMVGTDPFTIYGSVDPQVTMNKLKIEDRGDYWTYKNTEKDFWVVGGNYTSYKKETLDLLGGYIRDVDNNWILAKKGFGCFAIPKNHHVHHKIANNIKKFVKQKLKWSKYYFLNPQTDREFGWNMGWFGKFGKIRFGYEVIRNLLFFPNAIESLFLFAKQKQKAWLLHAPMKFITTFVYILAWIKTHGN